MPEFLYGNSPNSLSSIHGNSCRQTVGTVNIKLFEGAVEGSGIGIIIQLYFLEIGNLKCG